MENVEPRCTHRCPACTVLWEHVKSWTVCPLREAATCNPCLDQARIARRAQQLRADDATPIPDLFRIEHAVPTPKRKSS